MELPAMTEGLLDHNDEDHLWEPPVRNLDNFFSSMYKYHSNKGLQAILVSQFCFIISLGFTSGFSTFLIGFVDWDALKNCHDETSCGTIGHYVTTNPFYKFSYTRNFFTIIYLILLTAFWLWRTYHSLNVVRKAFEMEKFFREKLDISSSELQYFQWDEVIQRLIQLHESGIHRVAIKEKLTEHDVVLRIMRKDNYIIGLINKNILDLRVPWWISPFISERLFLTKSLEWSLSFCILEYMFNDQFGISSMFLKDVQGLKGRFMMVGFIHFLLLPFMIIFMAISFFLQNAQSFHTSKAYLGPRQWSPLALWTFREFNELPHIFEDRINKSFIPANEYIESFHNINVVLLAQSVLYISGSFIATILLVSIIAEGVVLYVDVYDHNFLWWLGVFSAIYASSRSLIPDEKKKIHKSQEELMIEISSHTHYFPEHWINNSHTIPIRNELAELFPYKIKLFFMELLSVVLTPIVLCFSLPKCVPSIIEFINEHSRYVEGVGAVCDYSLFEFERYGDERFGAPINGYMDSSRKPQNGKLEQSFINFQNAHPAWDGGSAIGREFKNQLDHFKLTREAEREMENNAILQSFYSNQNQNNENLMMSGMNMNTNNINNLNSINEQYISSSNKSDLQQPIYSNNNFNYNFNNNNINNANVNNENFVSKVNNNSNEINSQNQRQNQMNNSQMLNSQILNSQKMNSSRSIFNPPRNLQNKNNQLKKQNNNVPSLLRSILNQENIDYENDFYWLNRFQMEKAKESQMGFSSSMKNSNLNINFPLGDISINGISRYISPELQSQSQFQNKQEKSNIFNTTNVYYKSQRGDSSMSSTLYTANDNNVNNNNNKKNNKNINNSNSNDFEIDLSLAGLDMMNMSQQSNLSYVTGNNGTNRLQNQNPNTNNETNNITIHNPNPQNHNQNQNSFQQSQYSQHFSRHLNNSPGLYLNASGNSGSLYNKSILRNYGRNNVKQQPHSNNNNNNNNFSPLYQRSVSDPIVFNNSNNMVSETNNNVDDHNNKNSQNEVQKSEVDKEEDRVSL